MLKMKFWTDEFNDRRTKMCAGILRRFGRDEDGSIIIFTIVLMVVMLVIGGMAVDFMRFESRRALLQSVSDRAVLAAAELDQDKDRATVVTDYFEKAGFGGAIIGTPSVKGSTGSKSVTVRSAVDVGTFYLRFVGIDTLTAPAVSSAIEGTGDIEISLVLDISGSMGENGGALDDDDNPTAETKLDLLKEAATNFNNRLLVADYQDQISISLVAYTAHVNLGAHIFNAINTTPPTRWDTSQWEAGEADEDTPGARISVPTPDDKTEVIIYTGESEDDPVYTSFTNPAHCVDIPESEFGSTNWDSTLELQQVEFYDPYGSSTGGPVRPICPTETFEAIIPLSQNAAILNAAINSYQPRTTTSIHDGMKWGVNMLDPSFRTILSSAPLADPAFRGVRPSNFATDASTLDTKKFVILLTDGANFQGFRLKQDDSFGDDRSYENVRQRVFWNDHSYEAWNNLDSDDREPFPNYTFETKGPSVTDKNRMLQSICDAAKDSGVIVYTIAMNADTEENRDDGISGVEAMQNCATVLREGQPNAERLFYDTTENSIDNIFQAIADQIVDLRLSL
ncbi:pilus assembly protein [Yoonia sp. 2307UL14-13]|uniref:pilus assembly protein n=1 Tax=Yoonia sp. 2307UL14-13 TaxID=3126506 RepID=UPI0030A4113F